MDLPWFREYPGDFTVQTSHLSTTQVGALTKLRHAMWVRPHRSVPSDHATLRRITGLPTRNFLKVIAPVLELCTLTDRGEWTVPELQAQFAHALIKRTQCVDAGRTGGTKAALNRTLKRQRGIPSSRQILNKNKESDLANATPFARANADIYQNQNLKSANPDLFDSSVGSPMKDTSESLCGALARLGEHVRSAANGFQGPMPPHSPSAQLAPPMASSPAIEPHMNPTACAEGFDGSATAADAVPVNADRKASKD